MQNHNDPIHIHQPEVAYGMDPRICATCGAPLDPIPDQVPPEDDPTYLAWINCGLAHGHAPTLVCGGNHNGRPSPCAVEGCTERGRPQVCPYDGRYHHHGMIHYGTIPSALTFPGPLWRDVCNTHYAVLVRELAAHKAARGIA